MMVKRRRLPPRPPDPPEGYMLFHQQLVPIQYVEATCKSIIGHHDDQCRAKRDRANYPEDYRK